MRAERAAKMEKAAEEIKQEEKPPQPEYNPPKPEFTSNYFEKESVPT